MKRVFSLPLIFALFLTSALAQNNTPAAAALDAKELTGDYIWSTGFVGAYYKLLSDGTYEYFTISDCCDPVWRETGSYSLRDKLLHFKVTTKTLNGHNMLDPKQATDAYRKVYNSPDEEIPADKMHTEYDLQVVRWGERIYLLDQDSFPQFVAAVNFGIEPGRHILGKSLNGKIFICVENVNKAFVGKPSLPEPWLSYLDNPPINATITNIKEQNNKRIYTLNKGSAGGLRIGMYLVRESEKLDYDNLLLVTAVEEGSATAKRFPNYSRTEPYRVGDTFTTKRVRNPR